MAYVYKKGSLGHALLQKGQLGAALTWIKGLGIQRLSGTERVSL